jgi:hypothetical protein
MHKPKFGDYDYEAFLDSHPIERCSLEKYYSDEKNRNRELEEKQKIYIEGLILLNNI